MWAGIGLNTKMMMGVTMVEKPANKGVYDNYYKMYPYLAKFMQEVNYNVYNLVDFF